MTYIKIKETLYPATISGKVTDKDWDNRESKAIKLEMDFDTALALFVDGLAWSIVQTHNEVVESTDAEGNIVTETVERSEEWDNSEYNLAGDITDHRDGRITVKMGKLTDLESAYEIMLGGM